MPAGLAQEVISAPNVASAGTFVAAVLEHQGYMFQALFLQTFKSFFRDAGALIFLLAGAGAVASYALLGSYRAVRYLVICPVLFWFLVGTTTKSAGVVWRLGDDIPRGLNRTSGIENAQSSRDKVIKMMHTKMKSKGEIDIAYAFWLFVKPINDFVTEVNSKLLNRNDISNYMVASKAQGLEIISAALVDDETLVGLIEEGLYGSCKEMMIAAQSVARTYVRENAVAEKTVILRSERERYLAQYLEHLDDKIPIKDIAYYQMIKNYIGRPGASKVFDNDPTAFSENVSSTDTAKRPKEYISCQNAWKLTAERIWHIAATSSNRTLRVATGVASLKQASQVACEELTRKLFKSLKESEKACNFIPAYALSMFYNHMYSPDSLQRILERHWNKKHLFDPRQINTWASLNYKDYEPYLDDYGHVFLWPSKVGSPMTLLVPKGTQASKSVIDKTKAKVVPVGEIIGLFGMEHVMWKTLRISETARIRQQLFTWSMQLPYFQGIMLFLCAVAYPFLCLVVLLPGKAHHLLNLPLAWFWLKSWDIGMAVVVLVDKVLYNLLPNWNITGDLATLDGWIQGDSLPKVISQAHNFDPLGSVHLYYTMLAMLTLGIPAITAAMTIKGKKAVLTPFIDAVKEKSSENAEFASRSKTIVGQNQGSTGALSFAGQARMLAINGGNFGSGRSGVMGRFYAALGFIGSGYEKGTPLKLGEKMIDEIIKAQGPKHIENILGASVDSLSMGETMLTGYKQGISRDINLARSLAANYDRAYGRWGLYGMFADASNAAADGRGTSYELTRRQLNSQKEMIEASVGLENMNFKLLGQVAYGEVKLIGDAFGSGKHLEGAETAAIIAFAHLAGGFSLEGLKSLLGAKNLTDAEFVSVIFMTDASRDISHLNNRFQQAVTYMDERIETISSAENIDPKKREEAVSQAKSSKRVLQEFLGVFSGIKSACPGGPSTIIDSYMSSSGDIRSIKFDPGKRSKKEMIEFLDEETGIVQTGVNAAGKSGDLAASVIIAERTRDENNFRKEHKDVYEETVKNNVEGIRLKFQALGVHGMETADLELLARKALEIQEQDKKRVQIPESVVQDYTQSFSLQPDLVEIALRNPLLATELIRAWEEARVMYGEVSPSYFSANTDAYWSQRLRRE